VAALGLYIHVPFCARICPYCNFNRGLFDAALADRYVAAVERHLERAAADAGLDGPPAADTIYFGGGTPSVLEPAAIARLIGACRQAFAVAPDAEITMEVNPDTAAPGALGGFRAAGVTRLSIGVQSVRDEELRLLGRLHDAAGASRAFAGARAAGFDNISLDLMMGLPGQTLAQWQESVVWLIAAAPEHASMYILEVYPHGALRADMDRQGLASIADDDAADMYEWAMGAAERAGLAQYEISNVARPGFESRHNLKYWTDGDWLGVGPGAHSTLGGVRWRTCDRTEDYVAAIGAGSDVKRDRRVLTTRERWEEALITGLRLTRGVAVDDLREKYGLDIWARYGDHLQPYLAAGHLLFDGRRLRLSRQGMLLANEVLAVFI